MVLPALECDLTHLRRPLWPDKLLWSSLYFDFSPTPARANPHTRTEPYIPCRFVSSIVPLKNQRSCVGAWREPMKRGMPVSPGGILMTWASVSVAIRGCMVEEGRIPMPVRLDGFSTIQVRQCQPVLSTNLSRVPGIPGSFCGDR